MAVFYLAALIVGAGSLVVQLFVGHDVQGDLAGAGVHLDAGGVHDAGHDAPSIGVATIFLSLRFWTFGLLAFGLVGSLLHYLEFAGSTVTLLAAAVMGTLSGVLASWTFFALSRASVNSGAEAEDAVGQVGKVLIGCKKGKIGKIRLEVRGQTVDYLASTDDDALEEGSDVLVEEVRGDTLHVSRAPEVFVSGSRQ